MATGRIAGIVTSFVAIDAELQVYFIWTLLCCLFPWFYDQFFILKFLNSLGILASVWLMLAAVWLMCSGATLRNNSSGAFIINILNLL